MYEIYTLRLDHYIEDQGDRHLIDERVDMTYYLRAKERKF